MRSFTFMAKHDNQLHAWWHDNCFLKWFNVTIAFKSKYHLMYFFLKSFGCALLYAIKLAQGMCFVHEKDFKTLLKIYKGWGLKTTSNNDGQKIYICENIF